MLGTKNQGEKQVRREEDGGFGNDARNQRRRVRAQIGYDQWRMLAETVAYGDLGSGNPAPIRDAYERHREPVIELQLEKAGVRLACLLDAALK
jgi:hypothetical protein